MFGRALPLVLLVSLIACGGGSDGGGGNPAGPTPPAATTFTLSGRITNAATGGGVGGATVMILDGPASSRSATADGNGNYTLANIPQSGFTARARAPYYTERSEGVSLTADRTQNFALQPIPLFGRSGSGDTVFDMPTHVRRIRIQGRYTRNSSNFVVYIAGRLVVNELLGTGWDATTFDGTYTTQGGVTEIKLSSGVQWTFTEVR